MNDVPVSASTGVELTLLGKPTAAGVSQVTAAVSAPGVYDLSRRFVGTVGLIRQVPEQKKGSRDHAKLPLNSGLTMFARSSAKWGISHNASNIRCPPFCRRHNNFRTGCAHPASLKASVR